MKTPPYLISAALLFWGWQTGLLPPAALFAIGFESQRFIKTRWELSRAEWSHVTDLCTIILLGIVTVGFFHEKSRLIFYTGKLLPCAFFPLLAAQQYSVSGKVDLTALSLIARRKKKNSARVFSADVSYLFFLTCLISAGFGNRTDGSYYIGICLLGTWAAYALRSRHVPLSRWVLLLLITTMLSFTLDTGMVRIQQILTHMIRGYFQYGANPLKSITSIADIGSIKMDDTIAFRATADPLPEKPILLREASYNVYRSPNWYALRIKPVRRIQLTGEETVYFYDPTANSPSNTVHIYTRIRRGKDTMKLPGGTFQIALLPECAIETSRLGAVVMKGAKKNFIEYEASFSPSTHRESPPDNLDLQVPERERPAIDRFIKQYDLKDLPPDKLTRRLLEIFNTDFGYTLEIKGRESYRTPIANFLLGRKAGHCEFFATATVLILRACNIPARYTVGYAAAEYNPFEKQFIIRHRHAHAWTRLFIDGHWQNLDTTSSNWLALENKNHQSPFRFITDFGSFLFFKLSQFFWSEKDYMGKVVVGLLLLLIAMIGFRLWRQKKTDRRKSISRKKRTKTQRESSFDDIMRLETELGRKRYPRYPGETLLTWAERIQQANPDLLNYNDLQLIIRYHYNEQFAPDHPPKPNNIIESLQRLLQKLKSV